MNERTTSVWAMLHCGSLVKRSCSVCHRRVFLFVICSAGEINWNVVRAFARVYARAISGIPTFMDFDLRRRHFHLEWWLSVTIHQPTEVFIPQIQYPHGFSVYVSQGLSWTFDSASSVLYISNVAFHTTANVYLGILPKEWHRQMSTGKKGQTHFMNGFKKF